MFAKFGLILIVVAFGACLFVLGILAPESVRSPVTRVAQELTAVRKKSALPTAPHVSVAKDVSTGTKQPAGPAPVPYQQLMVPTPLPLDGLYALQLGLFPTVSNATAWVERARSAGVPATTIGVVDENGGQWIAVAAGQYSSPDDARSGRILLTRTLSLAQALPVIRLPPKPPAPNPTAP